MLFVAKWQIQNCLLDHFKASIFSHALCAEKQMIAQQIIDYRFKQSLLLSPPYMKVFTYYYMRKSE